MENTPDTQAGLSEAEFTELTVGYVADEIKYVAKVKLCIPGIVTALDATLRDIKKRLKSDGGLTEDFVERVSDLLSQLKVVRDNLEG